MKTEKYYVLLLILVLIFLPGCGLTQPSPSKTVQDFYQAVQDGEVQTATSLLSNYTVQNIGKDKLQQVLIQQSKNMNSSGGIRAVNILEEQITGDLATVTVEVVFNDGTSNTEVLNLVKENKKWKIDLNK